MHTGHLGFGAFLKGLATYCKCTQEEKVKLVFSLFDMENNGFIQKKDMITIVDFSFN